MKLQEKSDSFLFEEYALHQAYKQSKFIDSELSYSLPQLKLSLFQSFLHSKIANSIETLEEKDEKFNQLYRGIIDTLYSKFNVECIDTSFQRFVEANRDKMLSSVPLDKLYDTLGLCSGYLVFGKWCAAYSITKEVSSITCQLRNDASTVQGLLFFRGNEFSANDFIRDCCDEADTALYLGLAILIARKLTPVETKIVEAGKKSVNKKKGEKISNKTPFPVYTINSSWYKTIVCSGGFYVRGFFRLQRYGYRRSKSKLIYIKPQYRHGYVRRAGKLIPQEKEIREVFRNNIRGEIH